MKDRNDPPATAPERPRRRMHTFALAALAGLLGGGDASAEAAPRPETPAQLAEADAPAGDDVEPISFGQLAKLANDRDPERQMALAALLPAAIAWMRPMERVELIASWTTSKSPRQRLAIARALRHAQPVPGSLAAIEHLAGDPDPEVRVAVAEAAWLRRAEDPTRMIEVLVRLCDDPNVLVSEVARLALGDA